MLGHITHEASKWISAKARARERFFALVALPAPHTPWLPTEPYAGASKAGPYGDFVVQVDDCVAHILSSLKVYGIHENTLVVFTSDNGAHWTTGDIKKYGHRANGRLRGQKADIYEGGHRVPFLARWPKEIPAGTERDDLVCLTDLYATFAAICGHDLADGEGEDSFNVLGVLQGADFSEPPRTSIVHHSHQGMFAIRSGAWKLIVGRGSGGFTRPSFIDPVEGEPTGQLFNLVNDLTESRDHWSAEPERVLALTALLESLRERGSSR